jgi:alkylation response protein AidB-like acyl-CoA dehydrogenase
MGLRGSPTREIVLDDVFVPEDRLVGNEGALLAEGGH